jgi:uncharacterized tellurite resistance protein B-like protein
VISRLRSLLGKRTPPASDAQRVPLAMAALLVEAARADHHLGEEELEELATLLALRLNLEPDTAADLLHRAREAVEKSVSLYEFTRPLQETFDYAQKEEFVRMLWRVALADRRLDKYEDYLIGKVSELLYVARGDVLRLKHEVLQLSSAATGGD